MKNCLIKNDLVFVFISPLRFCIFGHTKSELKNKKGGGVENIYNVDFDFALELSEKYNLPLYPKYIYYWNQISFEDFFWQRRFSSYIYAESNVYNNRLIQDYSVGLETLLEAERIKNWLFEMEHDLWEF